MDLQTVSVSLLSNTNVALNANADTTLYVVPTGARCILSHAVLVAGADAGETMVSIGADGDETDFIPANTLSHVDAAYDAVILKPVPDTFLGDSYSPASVTPVKNKSYAAGTVIQMKVTNYAGGATNNVYLYGMLI